MGPCEIPKDQNQDTEDQIPDQEVDSDQDIDDTDDDGNNERKKREAPVQQVAKYPANRTLVLNCTNPTIWKCKTLKCNLGPVLQRNNLETVYLYITADFSDLSKDHKRQYFEKDNLMKKIPEKQLGNKDIIQMKADATVKIIKPSEVKTPDEKQSVI